MEDPVHHAHGLAVLPGEGGVHRLGGVEEALPGHGAGFVVDRGVVEALVALPELHPDGMVVGGDGADFDVGGHGGPHWMAIRQPIPAAATVEDTVVDKHIDSQPGSCHAAV
ncbi:hypothetical protein D3C78_1563490 [compost metagenome]